MTDETLSREETSTLTILEDTILDGRIQDWCKSVLKRVEFPLQLMSITNLFQSKFDQYTFREQVLLYGAANFCISEIMGKLPDNQFNHITTIVANLYLTIIGERELTDE